MGMPRTYRHSSPKRLNPNPSSASWTPLGHGRQPGGQLFGVPGDPCTEADASITKSPPPHPHKHTALCPLAQEQTPSLLRLPQRAGLGPAHSRRRGLVPRYLAIPSLPHYLRSLLAPSQALVSRSLPHGAQNPSGCGQGEKQRPQPPPRSGTGSVTALRPGGPGLEHPPEGAQGRYCVSAPGEAPVCDPRPSQPHPPSAGSRVVAPLLLLRAAAIPSCCPSSVPPLRGAAPTLSQ